MPPPKQQLLHRFWPAALVAVAVFPPLFISPVSYAELSVSIISFGLLAAAAVRVARGDALRVPRGVAATVGVLVVWLVARSLFVTEPMIAFGGAWSSDGTVFALVAIAVAVLGLAGWQDADEGAPAGFDRTALTALFAVIALIAAGSSIAAWQWGPTDPSGGPPSGFTANSQLQLQLLTAGLTASLAWAALRRRELPHLLMSAMCAIVVFVGMLECRSAVMLPALAVGAVYALAAGALRRKIRPLTLAAIGTAVVGLAHGLLVTLILAPATSSGVVTLLDGLGSGRGTLWSIAIRAIAGRPLAGYAPAHSASLSAWVIDGPVVTYVSTADPHSMVLALAAAGGVIAFAALLAIVFAVQLAWLRAADDASGEQLPVVLVIVAGSVMLFMLAQFTFVFTLGWVLMGILTGLVLRRSSANLVTVPRTPPALALTALVVAGAALLVSFAWVTLPGRAGSTTALMSTLSSPPSVVLQRQLEHIEHPWDLVPAEIASVYITAWSQGDPAQVKELRAAYDSRMTAVAETSRTDARMIAARLRVWATDAGQGRADLEALDVIVADGLRVSPGEGLWAAAGAAFHAHYGSEADARAYAAQVRGNADWWRQAQVSCDPGTLALIGRLAE